MQIQKIYELAQSAFDIDLENAVKMRDGYVDKEQFLIDLGRQIERRNKECTDK